MLGYSMNIFKKYFHEYFQVKHFFPSTKHSEIFSE